MALLNIDTVKGLLGDGSKFSLAIVGAVALLMAFGALAGFFRGFSRQVIRLITVAASFVVAYFIATKINGRLVGLFVGKSVEEILDSFGAKPFVAALGSPAYDIIISLDFITVEQTLAIAFGVVLTPLIFMLLFLTISSLMLPIHKVLSTLFGFFRSRNNPVTRLMGLIVGAAQGALVSAIVLFPIAAVGITAQSVVETIGQPDSDSEQKVVDFCNVYLGSSMNHPIIKRINAYGGETIAHNFAVFESNGVTYDVRDPIPAIVDITTDIISLSGMNIAELTDQQRETIKGIPVKVGKDEFTVNFISGTVRSIAHIADSGIIPMDAITPPFDSLIFTLIGILETTDNATVEADLTTIANVLLLLSDSGVISKSGQDAIDALIVKDENGDTLVKLIMDEFENNRHTKPLVTQITKVTISLMMSSTLNSGSGTEGGAGIDTDYETIKSGLNNVVAIDKTQYEGREEEYYEAVSESLNSTLVENGIELAPEVVDSMAQYIGDTYGDKDEISDEEFNDIMMNYYDSYLEYLETGKVPDNLPDGIKPDDVPEGVNPDDIPEGINPDDIPEGFDPDDLPEGFDPDDIPEGVNPDDIIGGLNPDDLPEDANPDDIPEGSDN